MWIAVWVSRRCNRLSPVSGLASRRLPQAPDAHLGPHPWAEPQTEGLAGRFGKARPPWPGVDPKLVLPFLKEGHEDTAHTESGTQRPSPAAARSLQELGERGGCRGAGAATPWQTHGSGPRWRGPLPSLCSAVVPVGGGSILLAMTSACLQTLASCPDRSAQELWEGRRRWRGRGEERTEAGAGSRGLQASANCLLPPAWPACLLPPLTPWNVLAVHRVLEPPAAETSSPPGPALPQPGSPCLPWCDSGRSAAPPHWARLPASRRLPQHTLVTVATNC